MTAVSQHQLEHDHKFDWDGTKILIHVIKE